MYLKRLLKLRILYFKVAVAHDNNKKLLYLGCFSIFLVKILDTGKQVSPSSQHMVNIHIYICTEKTSLGYFLQNSNNLPTMHHFPHNLTN